MKAGGTNVVVCLKDHTFQVQDCDLEYFFSRFEKHIALSEKKLPLASNSKLLTKVHNSKI